MPLLHRPGEAQVDFGHALANVNGQLRKVAFFVMALPYSDATFVMAFEREGTETFWEGHVRAFEFFQGVPRRITYDNTKVAVSKILGKERRLTQGFLQLKSHYLFDHHFCRVARGNEKGVVEGQVKFTRLGPAPAIAISDLKAAGGISTGMKVIDITQPTNGTPPPLWIIDGQHRITGLGETGCAQKDNFIPVVLLLNNGGNFYGYSGNFMATKARAFS